MKLPNKTIYIKDSDLPIWDRAQNKLGESISSIVVECLRERLHAEAITRKVGKSVTKVEAMNDLLAEINATGNLDLELHPSFSPIILESHTDNIGYKLHQKRANPDRTVSLVVSPFAFDSTGRLTTEARDQIKVEIKRFWDGKRTDRHALVQV
jgi:hypothetical protein